MKLNTFEQICFTENPTDYDLVVAASGYESRARHVAEIVGPKRTTAESRLVLAFEEHKHECARPENDAVFKRLGYESIMCRGSSDQDVNQVVADAVEKLRNLRAPRVLVDISSMTRAWYGAIVRSLMRLKFDSSLAVHFAYTSAEYVPPLNDYPPNRVVGPVAGFSGNTLPSKPTALILGLGYDLDRAIGLKDYLDPQLTVLFYADPGSNSQFASDVRKVNKGLFNEVSKECVFPYPIDDATAAFRSLESLSNGLTRDWRVVLCSLGPKVFGLYCFLVASINGEISIWRVSADSHESPIDRVAAGPPLLLQTKWI